VSSEADGYRIAGLPANLVLYDRPGRKAVLGDDATVIRVGDVIRFLEPLTPPT